MCCLLRCPTFVFFIFTWAKVRIIFILLCIPRDKSAKRTKARTNPRGSRLSGQSASSLRLKELYGAPPQASIRFRLRHGAFIAYTCTSNCSYMYKQLLVHVRAMNALRRRRKRIEAWSLHRTIPVGAMTKSGATWLAFLLLEENNNYFGRFYQPTFNKIVIPLPQKTKKLRWKLNRK